MKVPARPPRAPATAINRNEPEGASNLYLVRGDLAFTPLRPALNDEWRWRGGFPVKDAWADPELTAIEGGAGTGIPVDCLSLATGADGLVLSEFGKEALFEPLAATGEFWPVRVLGQRYWWFNCLACVDVLDRERTDADWSMVEGDWGSFSWITSTRRLAFRADELRMAPPIFRVPEYPQGVLFAREVVRGWIEQSDLTGFRMDLVWSAENGGVADPPGLGLAGIFDVTEADRQHKRDSALSSLRRRERGGMAASGR